MINFCKVNNCRFKFSHTTKSHNCGKCKLYGHGIIECNNINLINNLKKFYSDKINENEECKFGGCIYKKYHNINSHQCNYCYGRLHSQSTCPLLINKQKNNIEYYNIICPICKTTNNINKNQSKLYGNNDNCVICMDNNIEIFFPNCGHACICLNCCNKIKINNSNIEPIIYNETEIKNKFLDYPCYTIVYQRMGCFYIFRRLNNDNDIENIFIHSDDHMIENIELKINNFINGYALID